MGARCAFLAAIDGPGIKGGGANAEWTKYCIGYAVERRSLGTLDSRAPMSANGRLQHVMPLNFAFFE